MKMVSEITKCNNVIHKSFKKCEFCGQKLKPIGLDFLYDNISPDDIEYERCDCDKAREFWDEKDLEQNKIEKQTRYREIIKELYQQSYIGKRFQENNFENFKTNSSNKNAVEMIKDYTNKCINNALNKGIIITGESGVGKTHLASSVANKLIENDKIVLIGRLSQLLDIIKETFKNSEKSENELIELYSNVDMLIIDDLGTEKISNWALDKLYTIIENRNENRLPIIITTRFDKDELIERFKLAEDKALSDAVISKLYQMCYGITLKNKKEKDSTSDQTKC